MDVSTSQDPAAVQRLKSWVEATFPGSFVVESHGGLLKYGVPPQDEMTFGKWLVFVCEWRDFRVTSAACAGQIFRLIEENKAALEIL